MFNDLGIWAETVLRLRQLSESQQMLLQQLDAAQRNAQIDPLLQVWNQQGIRALVEQELQLRTQTPRPLLIASVSLDQYPSLQQRYGVDFAN
jgi:GGDEF domain-containing protein